MKISPLPLMLTIALACVMSVAAEDVTASELSDVAETGLDGQDR